MAFAKTFMRGGKVAVAGIWLSLASAGFAQVANLPSGSPVSPDQSTSSNSGTNAQPNSTSVSNNNSNNNPYTNNQTISSLDVSEKGQSDLLTLDQQRGLRALFEANRSVVQRPVVNSPYIARDMDTWDDYRALHEDVFGSLPGEQGS